MDVVFFCFFAIQTVVIGQISKNGIPVLQSNMQPRKNLWSFGAENSHLMRRTWCEKRKTADNTIEYLCKQDNTAVQALNECTLKRARSVNMTIIVCDDSRTDRENLIRLLRDYEKKKGLAFDITEYDSGEALLQNIDQLQDSSILFLDINMAGTDGLDAAAQIKSLYPKISIVLVTAYIGYALEGYKVEASRFLVKDDLEVSLTECMDMLVRKLEQDTQVREFSFVEGNIRLKLSDILYIETARHKNIFYTKNGSFQIYKKLDEIENELRGYGFVRIHMSFLVNMRYIRKISSYVMTLTTGKEISVPKTRYAEVKKQYMLFKGVE